MAQPKIIFYIDIISPFGYIAYYMLRNSPTFKNTSLTLVPILLGGLHKLCNNTAPILVKNKSLWINKERQRWAEQFSIPIRSDPPPGFPISTVSAMRALVSLQNILLAESESGESEEKFARCTDVLWAAVWCPDSPILKDVKVNGKRRDELEGGEFDVRKPDVLKGLLACIVGEEMAGRAVDGIGEKGVKDTLVGNTQGAFEAGAFGIPWFQCTNAKGLTEGFWGFDHLGQVVRFLEFDDVEGLGRSGLRALL